MPSRLSVYFVTSLAVVAMFVLQPSAALAGSPPLQLPWPSGTQQRINNGDSYGCSSGHQGADLYAIDFSHYNTTVTSVAAGTVYLRGEYRRRARMALSC